MEERPDIPAEPSPARSSERPIKQPWETCLGIFFIALFLLACSPVLFFTGCLFTGYMTQAAMDHAKGPLLLIAKVRVVSPDGKIRFEADRDGTIRLVLNATGRTLFRKRVSVEEYRGVTATWQDNRHVTLHCAIRYPALARQLDYIWDSKEGMFKDESLVATSTMRTRAGSVIPPSGVKPTIPKPARVIAKSVVLGMPLSKVLKSLGKPDDEFYRPVPPDADRSRMPLHAGGFVRYRCADGVLYVEFDDAGKIILVSGNGFNFGVGHL